MKKFFIILALALATTLNLYAQNEWKHEIGISYGLGTFTDVNSSYLSGIFSGKQVGTRRGTGGHVQHLQMERQRQS